jgi:hypothetical protein
MKVPSGKTASGKSTGKTGKDSMSDLQAMADEAIKFIENKAMNMDKAQLAKYVGIAVLAFYGLRRSNILGSIAMSIVTGMVAKYVQDKMEGTAPASPSAN